MANSSAFFRILDKFRSETNSERDKGGRFECLMQAYLRTTPLYAGDLDKVWLWSEFPYRDQLGGKDTGIDLGGGQLYRQTCCRFFFGDIG